MPSGSPFVLADILGVGHELRGKRFPLSLLHRSNYDQTYAQSGELLVVADPRCELASACTPYTLMLQF
jgi:hypothetical protein